MAKIRKTFFSDTKEYISSIKDFEDYFSEIREKIEEATQSGYTNISDSVEITSYSKYGEDYPCIKVYISGDRDETEAEKLISLERKNKAKKAAELGLNNWEYEQYLKLQEKISKVGE